MEETIKHCIEDGNETGLYRISFPTGSGKSFQAVNYMVENYNKLPDEKHFFYLTSKKINIPKKQLLDKLGEEEYNDSVIVLKSYLEYILDNFKIEDIPMQFIDQPILQLNVAIDKYKRKKEKNIYDAEEMNEMEKKLSEAEFCFRTYIYNIIKNLKELIKTTMNFNGENNDKNIEKIIYDYLKNDNEYKWIGKIYENIFVKDYKIILMSMTKFMKKNQPFYEPRYSFINGNITDKAIIFIDEFDSTKETINNELIERSINNICEYISLSETICRNIINYKKFPKMIQECFELHPIELKNLMEVVEENFNKYRLDLKYKCEELVGRNFLFNDFTYQSILNSDRRIYVEYCEEKENMLIKFTKKDELQLLENSKNTINMYNLIRSLNRMIYSFKEFLYKASKTYMEKYNGSKKSHDDIMNFENALSTLCSLFNFDQKAEKFMRNGLNDKFSKKKIIHDLSLKTNDYYSKGFKFYEFQNKLSNNEFTLFNITELGETPESIIAALSSKAKVIGLSATINVDSVLCNYSQEYLKRTLGINYREVMEEDFNRVKNYYQNVNEKYCSSINPNGEIKVHVKYVNKMFGVENDDIKKQISVIYKDKRNIREIDKLFNIRCGDDRFTKERYLSVTYVFKEFMMNPQIKSFLCLTNPTMKINGRFDEDVIRRMFELVINENNLSIQSTDCLDVLKSGPEFEYKKENLLKRLQDGEKIFVMAAYGTLEAGQNLTYKPAKTDILINLNNEIDVNDSRNFNKDFDAIYLGEMTNITTNLYDKDNAFSKKDLFHYLIEVENLYENNEISHKELKLAIMNGFYRYSDRNSKCFDPIKPLLKSKCGKITKQTVQSIGRLCRTFNKRSDIYIYISKSVFDKFDPELIKNDLICPEVQAICDYVNEHRGKLIYEETNNRAERISYASKDYIFKLLSYEWNDVRIKLWKELREKVLTLPTVSAKKHDKDVIFREYYITSNEKIDRYYFYEINDFSEVYILFDNNKHDAIRRMKDRFKKQQNRIEEVKLKECSYENCRLEQILKYDGMIEFFKMNHYATSFKLNDYIMSPVLYQNIYKGALGEVAGKFILEKELGIQLQELSTEYYEYFDYQLTNDIYIDFKHWRMNNVNKNEYLEKIDKKLTEIRGRKAYVINLMDTEQGKDKITETFDGRIIEVPFLLDMKDYKANREIIEMLEEDVHYGR